MRLFWFIFLLVSPSLIAQINWGEYSQSFPQGALDKPETVALILTIPKTNNSFWVTQENSPHFLSLEKDSSFRKIRASNVVARTTFDDSKAHFFLHGVNKNNVQEFEFRVMEYPSQQLLVSWQNIAQLTDEALIKSSALPQMAYLGGYKTSLGNALIVDVRKKGAKKIAATSIVAWETIRPAATGIFTSENLDVFLQKLQYPWARPTSKHIVNYSLDNLQLPANNAHLIFTLNAEIYTKNQVQYQLMHNDRIVRPWRDNEYDNSFIWLKDFSSGRYKIQIRYAVQPQHVTEYAFEVAPHWYQTWWFKTVIAGIGMVVVGLGVFIYLLIRQRRRTQQEMAHKQKLQLELKALYAQLNPHFIFNALSSIQGLINHQNLKGANDYLADFAQLLRETLTQSSQEETSLFQELQTMETYLKLEQLRFGFRYSMEVDTQLDVYATSLPSLLWQPLVENAIKHGISVLQGKGVISVLFQQKGEALCLIIRDNGQGFDTKIPTTGFGLKLTKERIALLNQLNHAQPISLTIETPADLGTQVTLTFNHWFV
ncbi:two-component sensor histidine kinase [Runella defluvii]|uniref:Two-component sensor histidine kinase n=1 Tax=Runella defluvii TaxID=370973 RepID=A0A7W5ZTA2_9BACT|nr:histidine kinase [Runella defluvii]MBB3841354.1 two-component sensor histidine kinase [Runella defluvii]